MSQPDWRGYWLAAWGGVILTGLGVVVVAWQGKWHGILILSGFALAEMVFLLKSDRPPAPENFQRRA